jgi:hypothetical protein
VGGTIHLVVNNQVGFVMGEEVFHGRQGVGRGQGLVGAVTCSEPESVHVSRCRQASGQARSRECVPCAQQESGDLSRGPWLHVELWCAVLCCAVCTGGLHHRPQGEPQQPLLHR